MKLPPVPTRERFHYRGKYIIRTEQRGSVLLYDVLTKSGLLVAAGFDAVSLDEKTALEGITDRLYGRAQAA